MRLKTRQNIADVLLFSRKHSLR